ncbi:MAG: magnesium transporter CorA [Firmicutes bacterium]|nr:magnesium transporter CorA [Bacillota bacterium]
MYYLIGSTLAACSAEECHSGKGQYVAVLTPEEWQRERDDFEMGIDMDISSAEIHTTKAEVNYDSVTGTFSLPRKDGESEEEPVEFAFALDEKGIVFIDSGDAASQIIDKIAATRKWRMPCLERFIYDFLEQTISEDLTLLERYESELDEIEKAVSSNDEMDLDRMNRIRNDLRELRNHYERMIDLSQELEENENSFFKPDNLRFFSLFTKRASRLYDRVNSLLEYTLQIRDNYKSRLDDKQNRIITVLTVVTTIFMPLTLIAGWYGMNFIYMPELRSVYGYPAVIIVSVLIVVLSLLFFKRKKWL